MTWAEDELGITTDSLSRAHISQSCMCLTRFLQPDPPALLFPYVRIARLAAFHTAQVAVPEVMMRHRRRRQHVSYKIRLLF
jgi:hypothetical protein